MTSSPYFIGSLTGTSSSPSFFGEFIRLGWVSPEEGEEEEEGGGRKEGGEGGERKKSKAESSCCSSSSGVGIKQS